MGRYVQLLVRGHPIHCYIFINPRTPREEGQLESKVRGLQPLLERMPQPHVTVLYPIFFIEEKPGGQQGGGTWRHGEVAGAFLGRRARTGLPDDKVRGLVIDRGTGMIGIPRNRWPRPLQRLKFTVFHEIAHCVDYGLNITPPGATERDFAGVAPTCGGASLLKRRAVEAYARWMLIPANICGEISDPAQRAVANRRVIGVLRRSPAFRSIPATWRPGRVP
jgi:hypothetical protein